MIEATPDPWPFDDPPNVAVLSLKRVVGGQSHILLVDRGKEEGMWQFLDDGDISEEDVIVVSLARMVQIDSSLRALAKLPRGWSAQRKDVSEGWVISPSND